MGARPSVPHQAGLSHARQRRITHPISHNMVNHNLIELLALETDAADRMLREAFGDGTDIATILGDELAAVGTGNIVKGKVVGISGDFVIVDIRGKSEGQVEKAEFDEVGGVAIGDEVEVLVEETESADGGLTLSKRKADRIRGWEQLLLTRKEGDVVEGKALRKIKGGLLVDIGVPVFLPASQVDVRRPGDIGEHIGKMVRAVILKIDEERRNIVISRRKLIEEEREESKRKLMGAVKEGDVVRGTVTNIAEFGAFIDLGGLDGLLHITDMSWGRVNHPSEIVKIGDEIEVKILNIDRD
ncbi:MAG: ribosomal protein, partial [Planctomycetota bacterium]